MEETTLQEKNVDNAANKSNARRNALIYLDSEVKVSENILDRSSNDDFHII